MTIFLYLYGFIILTAVSELKRKPVNLSVSFMLFFEKREPSNTVVMAGNSKTGTASIAKPAKSQRDSFFEGKTASVRHGWDDAEHS